MFKQAELIHHVPGRVRISVPRIKGNPSICSAIGEIGTSVPGVQRIDANPVTGSVLVHYDRHDPDVEQRLAATLEDLDRLLPLIDPELAEAERTEAKLLDDVESVLGQTPIAASLRATSDRLDQSIQHLTHGSLTLAIVLPIALAGAGYLVLDDKRSSLLLGGLLAVSLHSLVRYQESSSRT